MLGKFNDEQLQIVYRNELSTGFMFANAPLLT